MLAVFRMKIYALRWLSPAGRSSRLWLKSWRRTRGQGSASCQKARRRFLTSAMIRKIPSIRSPVKREGAERYIFLSLISFAISVIFTRAFLQMTGYPKIGNGTLHIAHVLWGG